MIGNVSELLAPEGSIFERIMMRVIDLINIGGCDIPLAREEANQTPLVVIASVTTCFKRRRVFTLAIAHAPTPPIEAPKVLFPLPQLFILSVEEAIVETFTWANPEEFKDTFS